MSIQNWFSKIIGFQKTRLEVVKLRDQIVSGKQKDTRELHKLNATLRLSLQEGHIEVTIKNVDGVLRELRKGRSK